MLWVLRSVTHGLCRHRAQLFKYLADVDGVDIPCRLYRNFAPNGEEIRVWNTVPVSPNIDGMAPFPAARAQTLGHDAMAQ